MQPRTGGWQQTDQVVSSQADFEQNGTAQIPISIYILSGKLT
jgi:hypothetical protein